MSLTIVFSDSLESLNKDEKKFLQNLKKLLSYVLKNTRQTEEFLSCREILKSIPKDTSLYLCEDLEMREFQKKYRRLNRTTDVLSFPSREAPEGVLPGYFGDLIISIPTLKRNAKRYKRSFEKELYLVFTHGVLHLLGYEHVGVSKKKADQMKQLQEHLSKAFFQSIKA